MSIQQCYTYGFRSGLDLFLEMVEMLGDLSIRPVQREDFEGSNKSMEYTRIVNNNKVVCNTWPRKHPNEYKWSLFTLIKDHHHGWKISSSFVKGNCLKGSLVWSNRDSFLTHDLELPPTQHASHHQDYYNPENQQWHWKIPMFNRKYIFIHGGLSSQSC